MGDEATGHADGETVAVDGIDIAGLGAWFAAHVPGAQPPLSYERIAGGHSNLTYRVTDAAGTEWALRRPPLGRTLSSAHDMGREHKVVAALGGTPVPVAPVVGLCEDESVNGAPFYVMEFVRGPVLRGVSEAAAAFPVEGDRREIGLRVADTLAAIHAVDPDAVGLGDLGRKEDYVVRQLRRWYGQWEKSKTRDLAAIDRVHERLAARIPTQEGVSIVHGDYRLDNMILTDAGEVAAVVDWELCTLGDPLADVGTLMAYWPERGEERISLGMPANLAPGFPVREEIAARYAETSGRDLSELDFFVALGYWKLAIIL
ncbi:MAG TPA: phosphotransferase family protein, partial [Solirubrobacterales bacterium]|nr:phosphotransferase family protein [Solirubrobacterales bacterium]